MYKRKNQVYNRLIDKTTMHMEHFLDTFALRILNHDASLFIGAGVSRNSGLPSWKTVLEPCAKELGIDLTNETDLSDLAQYYANRHSDSDLRRLVALQINKYVPGNQMLDALVDLDFPNIWTTNYDKLIERAFDQRRIEYNVIANDQHLASIDRYNKINILKINGDISEPANIVLTHQDIENYAVKHQLFLTFLKKELVSNTFLFIGYSFSDNILLECLRDIKNWLGNAIGHHYAIMIIDKDVSERTEYFIDDLERRYGVIGLTMELKDVLPFLDTIKRRVREKKVFISGAFADISAEEERFADALSRELTHALFKAGYRISTGVGKKLGTYITGYGYQYIAEHGITAASRMISMRPFPFHLKLDDSVKKDYRINMMHDCSSAVFLFGQSQYNLDNNIFNKQGHYSNGVYQEFQIAQELGLSIIPVGVTGYEAEVIWNEVKANINKYYYLSKRIDLLYKEKRPDVLARLIVDILDNVSEYSHI